MHSAIGRAKLGKGNEPSTLQTSGGRRERERETRGANTKEEDERKREKRGLVIFLFMVASFCF